MKVSYNIYKINYNITRNNILWKYKYNYYGCNSYNLDNNDLTKYGSIFDVILNNWCIVTKYNSSLQNNKIDDIDNIYNWCNITNNISCLELNKIKYVINKFQMIIQNVVYIDNIKNFILLLKDMYDTCEKSVYQLQMGTGKTAILTPMILMHYCLYVDITQPNNAVITFVTKQQLLKSWFSIFINKLIHNVCDLNISYNTIKENYDYNWDKKHILIVDDIV